MKLKKTLISFITLFLLGITLFTSPFSHSASAAGYSFYNAGTWATVGYGYKTSGGFVAAVQANLWSAGLYQQTGSVDGRFGTSTQNGIKEYQRREGLAVDGIVGTGMLYIAREKYIRLQRFST